MKKKTKIILILLLILVLTIHISSKLLGKTFATSGGGDDLAESIESGLGAVADGLLGIFLLRPKFYFIIIGAILGILMGYFAADSSIVALAKQGALTVEDILFNRVQLLDINFFNFSGDPNSTSYLIKQNVAIWYTSIRNIAIIVLAIIAVYVGIRMAMSTIAEEKAKYKTMLIDWLTSLALVFVLHYIMIFTIGINNAFVNVLSKGLQQGDKGLLISTDGDMMNTFLKNAITGISFTGGMMSAIIYALFQLLTFIFLLTYLKRLITIAFLIVISPLVTITYSIDKMGDGRSQALNVWLKEFVYNILIQPFHCVSYLVLGTTVLQLMTNETNWLKGPGITKSVLAVAILTFILSTEKIVKKIFHFESDSMADVVAGAAIAGTVVNTAMNGVKKARAAGGTIKNFANNNSQQPPSTTPQQQNANQLAQTSTATATPTGTGTNPSGNAKRHVNTSKAKRPAPQRHINTSKAVRPSTNKKQPNIVGKVASGAAGAFKKAWSPEVRGAIGDKFFGTVVGMMPGIISQNATAMITGGATGYDMGAQHAEERNLKIRQREMARAVKNYKAVPGNESISIDDLTNNALEFADGTKIAVTEEEKALRDAMQKLQIQYAKQGLDEKKIIKQSKQVVKDIENGFITPVSSANRYTGKIKQVASNIKDSFGKKESPSESAKRKRNNQRQNNV